MISEGGCQCGGVRYQLSCGPIVVYACHCTDCQKQSSSAFGISVWVPREEFRLVKGEFKFWNAVADSGNTKVCAFCPNCGSRIYHSAHDQPEILSIKGGSLDDARNLHPAGHIWTRSGQSWALPKEKDTICYPGEPESYKNLIDNYSGARIQRP